MKIAGIVALSVILILVAGQVYSFFWRERQLSAALGEVEARLIKAKYDEVNLEAQVQYLANPLNLEKELRARFNYKKPGETMIIIVPPQSASSTPTSSN